MSRFATESVKDVIFEDKSDIWMRVVRYHSGFIGIEVCPTRQIINGGPVWNIYNDSAPANLILNFFFSKVGVDGVLKLALQDKIIKEMQDSLRSKDYDLTRLQREKENLEQKLLIAHSQMDSLQTDLARIKRGNLSITSDHPYR